MMKMVYIYIMLITLITISSCGGKEQVKNIDPLIDFTYIYSKSDDIHYFYYNDDDLEENYILEYDSRTNEFAEYLKGKYKLLGNYDLYKTVGQQRTPFIIDYQNETVLNIDNNMTYDNLFEKCSEWYISSCYFVDSESVIYIVYNDNSDTMSTVILMNITTNETKTMDIELKFGEYNSVRNCDEGYIQFGYREIDGCLESSSFIIDQVKRVGDVYQILFKELTLVQSSYLGPENGYGYYRRNKNFWDTRSIHFEINFSNSEISMKNDMRTISNFVYDITSFNNRIVLASLFSSAFLYNYNYESISEFNVSDMYFGNMLGIGVYSTADDWNYQVYNSYVEIDVADDEITTNVGVEFPSTYNIYAKFGNSYLLAYNMITKEAEIYDIENEEVINTIQTEDSSINELI